MKYLSLPVLIFSLVVSVFADTIELYSGEIINGTIAGYDVLSTKFIPESVAVPEHKPVKPRSIYNFRIKRTIPGNTYNDYLTAKEACKTADDFYKLAEFCRKNQLIDEANKMYETTLALDPMHIRAHLALGHKKQGEEWLTVEQIKQAEGYVKFKDIWVKESELEQARQVDYRKQVESALPLNLKLAVIPDADDEWFKVYSQQLKEYARQLWTVTEGLAYLATVEITDNATDSDIIIQNLDQYDISNAKDAGSFDIAQIGGKASPRDFVRQCVFAKLKFTSHENCILAKGFSTDKFCDMCLARIIASAPNIKWRQDWLPDPPEVKITIVNKQKK